MKIGVLTFHRCINYGSYWQARCLVEGLRGWGHDAVLLDHDAPEIRAAEWRCALQPRLPVRSSRGDLRAYAAKTRRFFSAFDRLPQSPRFALDQPGDAGSYDVVLVGSDEVWNFRHPWYGGRPLFFGEGLRARKLASYAASIGNYDAAEGMPPAYAERLTRFDAISVRDENTRQLIQHTLGQDPALVLDPCLLFPPPEPVGDEAAAIPQAPYIAVYGHGLPDWLGAALRTAAGHTGQRLVSIGYRNEWADENLIDVGPEAFAALIAGADAVATNFFHGCVFALRYGRPLVTAPSQYRFNKVRDLTHALAARHHVVSEKDDGEVFSALLRTPPTKETAARIAALHKQSVAYLAAVLDSAR